MLGITILLSVHVLCGVLWAGSTFVVALTGASRPAKSRWPRIAGVCAILTGGLASHLLHLGTTGEHSDVLAAGAAFALAAGAVQAITDRRAQPAPGASPEAAGILSPRLLAGQRVAAAFLAITVVCMAASRYV